MKKRKKKKLHISFLLDCTGSMLDWKGETIQGFNEYLRELKEDRKGKPTAFTLTLFNSGGIEIRHNGVPLSKVKELTPYTYLPTNLTPLYDAIGQTINALDSSVGDDKALVVILTDGYENHSKEFSLGGVSDMIKERQDKKGWAFVYLGANQDAWTVGMGLGFVRSNVMTFDQQSTVETMHIASRATATYSASDGAQASNLIHRK